MSAFLCRLLVHRWSKWSSAERGQVHVTMFDGAVVSLRCFVQERTCERCGRTQMKEIK